MDFITPKGYEAYGLTSEYIDGDITTKTRGSIVKARAIEVLLRELHNAVAMSGMTPSSTDYTQLYQAIRCIGMGWSDTINYRNTTLVLGSNDKLYLSLSPSGPDVLLSDGRYAGPKNPLSSPLHWEQFNTFRDNGVDNLDILIAEIRLRIDDLEPMIQDIIDTSIQQLLDLHKNGGLASNTVLGHVTQGMGTVITDYGKIDVVVDNNTLLIDSNNKLYVNESVIKPNVATSSSVGICKIGTGLDITDEMSTPPEGYVAGKLSVADHSSEDPAMYGQATFQLYGHAKVTDDFEQTASAVDGVVVSPLAVLTAKNRLLGLRTETIITSSRDFVAPEAAVYRVTVVGGGGSGGSGGTAYNWSDYVNDAYWEYTAYSGGGGGGGGAGETLVRDVTLAKGESVPVIVGGPGGNSSFGSHAVARGGGRGGNGGSGSRGSGIPNGGGGGTSYGSGAGSGGRGSWNNKETPSITGGGGGAGGRSTHGQYGHGGNGGSGGGYSSGRRTSPSGGVSGTQGVVIITLNLGG